MSKAQVVIDALRKLNEFEDQIKDCKESEKEALRKEINAQRAKIPKPIQGHHDRIRVKGRSSVAAVRTSNSTAKWICGSCHIEIPRGMHGRLQVVTDITLCENCGAYLYFDKEVQEAAR